MDFLITLMKEALHLLLVKVNNFNFLIHYFLEETTWFVTSSPLPISYTTIEYFRDILKPQTVIIIMI